VSAIVVPTGNLGPAFMNQGNLIFSGLGSATSAGSPITLNVGGNLTLDNSGPNPFAGNRLNSADGLTSNGGSFTMINNPSLPFSQQLGVLTLNQGTTTITLLGTSGGAT